PQPPHQRVEDAHPVAGKEIDGRAVGGEADGRVDVGQGAFPMRSAESSAESRPDGAIVVGSPGIKDARVNDGQRAGNHRRAKLRIPDALKCRVVPEQNDAIAGGEYLERKPAQRRSGRSQGSPLQGGSASNGQSLAGGAEHLLQDEALDGKPSIELTQLDLLLELQQLVEAAVQ